jgi:MFS family permease
MGFTLFGGIYSLLMNLYLLRLGYGPEFVGLIHAVGLLAWAGACLPAAAVGRRIGSRAAMIAGMGLAALGYVLLPLAGWAPRDWQAGWLIATYLWGNLLIAFYDVNAGPFLMDITTTQERDHVFSVQAALWPLAGFLGSLVGGALPGFFAGVLGVSTDHPTPYSLPLVIAAAMLFLGAWAMQRTCVTITSQATEAAEARTTIAPLSLIAFLGVVVLLQGAGEGAARSFFNVYMDAGLHVATMQIGTVAALAQLLGAPGALAMPLATGRWGHRNVFVWGSLGMALTLVLMALIPHWTAAGLAYVGMIALVSLVRPALGVYSLAITPHAWRTALSAVTTMTLGLSWAGISAGGGYMIVALGYLAFFLIGAGLTALGVAVFVLNRRLGEVSPRVTP